MKYDISAGELEIPPPPPPLLSMHNTQRLHLRPEVLSQHSIAPNFPSRSRGVNLTHPHASSAITRYRHHQRLSRTRTVRVTKTRRNQAQLPQSLKE
jgi:hypothetical protein